MRELHTRYGRENIGYLWLIGEPLMLASVMAAIHTSGHTEFGSDIKPMPFIVIGYTTYIMFRGIVNRSAGAFEVNAPLLYHRSVTLFDIVFARALLEMAGVFLAYATLMLLLTTAGLMELPKHPLWLFVADGFMFWYSWTQSMIISAISLNRTIERLTHAYTYLSIPISAAFFQINWLPEPYRSYIAWVPMADILEMARYGQFRSATFEYCNPLYVFGWCLVLTWIGLITLSLYRKRIHLR